MSSSDMLSCILNRFDSDTGYKVLFPVVVVWFGFAFCHSLFVSLLLLFSIYIYNTSDLFFFVQHYLLSHKVFSNKIT